MRIGLVPSLPGLAGYTALGQQIYVLSVPLDLYRPITAGLY